MYRLFLVAILVTAMFSCKKEIMDCPNTVEKTFDQTGFTKISAGESYQVTVKQGASFSIKAKGCVSDLADLDVSIKNGGFLDIHYARYKNNRYRMDLEITMPMLTQITLGGTAKGNVSGFGGQTVAMRAVLGGAATCIIEDLPLLVKAELGGTSELFLHGTTGDLIGNVGGASRLHAYTATISDIDVYTDGTAKAYVRATKSLVALAGGDSRIYYKGNPGSVNIEKSGTAQVIHE